MLAPLALATSILAVLSDRQGDDFAERFRLIWALDGPVVAWEMFFRENVGQTQPHDDEYPIRALATRVVKSASLEELKQNLEELWYCQRGFGVATNSPSPGSFATWINPEASPIVNGRRIRLGLPEDSKLEAGQTSLSVALGANIWPLGLPWFVKVEDKTDSIRGASRSLSGSQNSRSVGTWFLTPYRFHNDATGGVSNFYTRQYLVCRSAPDESFHFLSPRAKGIVSSQASQETELAERPMLLGHAWSGDKDRLLVLFGTISLLRASPCMDLGLRIVPIADVVMIQKP